MAEADNEDGTTVQANGEAHLWDRNLLRSGRDEDFRPSAANACDQDARPGRDDMLFASLGDVDCEIKEQNQPCS